MVFIHKILITFWSLLIILLYLYMRIKQNRNIIELQKENIEIYYSYFLYSFFISIIILLSLLLLLVYHNNKKPNSHWVTIFSKLNYHIDKINIFYRAYGIIFEFLSPTYTQYLVFFTKRFINWKMSTKKLLLCLFVVLPRFIIIMILLFDLYQHKLQYYFYSLLLLLIPLLFRFLIFILNDIGPRLIPEFKKLVDTDSTDDTTIILETSEGIKRTRQIGFRFKPEYADGDIDYFMFNFYYPVLFIEGEMEVNFMPVYIKITQVTLLFYYSIHIFVLTYILFII